MVAPAIAVMIVVAMVPAIVAKMMPVNMSRQLGLRLPRRYELCARTTHRTGCSGCGKREQGGSRDYANSSRFHVKPPMRICKISCEALQTVAQHLCSCPAGLLRHRIFPGRATSLEGKRGSLRFHLFVRSTVQMAISNAAAYVVSVWPGVIRVGSVNRRS